MCETLGCYLPFLLPESPQNFLIRESLQSVGTSLAFPKRVSLPGFSLDLFSVPLALVTVTSPHRAQTISLSAAMFRGDFCVFVLFDFSGAPSTADLLETLPSFPELPLLALLLCHWVLRPCLPHFSFLCLMAPRSPSTGSFALAHLPAPTASTENGSTFDCTH